MVHPVVCFYKCRLMTVFHVDIWLHQWHACLFKLCMESKCYSKIPDSRCSKITRCTLHNYGSRSCVFLHMSFNEGILNLYKIAFMTAIFILVVFGINMLFKILNSRYLKVTQCTTRVCHGVCFFMCRLRELFYIDI